MVVTDRSVIAETLDSWTSFFLTLTPISRWRYWRWISWPVLSSPAKAHHCRFLCILKTQNSSSPISNTVPPFSWTFCHVWIGKHFRLRQKRYVASSISDAEKSLHFHAFPNDIDVHEWWTTMMGPKHWCIIARFHHRTCRETLVGAWSCSRRCFSHGRYYIKSSRKQRSRLARSSYHLTQDGGPRRHHDLRKLWAWVQNQRRDC